MSQFLFYKNKLIITCKLKINLKNKKIKKTKQSVMFLRSPKHFKRGKQFLFHYSSYVIKTININNINTTRLICLPHKQLSNIIFYSYLKSSIPKQSVKKISLKYNVKVNF